MKPKSSSVLTITDAARLLGVDPGTVRTWTERKLLPVVCTNLRSGSRIARQDAVAFAKRVGIDLDRDPSHPSHFTPPLLAEAIGGGMTAARIRAMIEASEIAVADLPPAGRRRTLLISQREGLRVITMQARRKVG